MSNKSSALQQTIALPTGGGALKGIGETFQPNLFTGTANYTIPIAVSPGRNGVGPSLSLQYSSGNGNGPFGLGWQLSLARITRKTEKGLPKYDDTDVFVMSGAEDLVPALKKVVDPISGEDTWIPEDPISQPFHTVRRYRPRIEGIFARIEKWEHHTTGEVHWRAITRENVTSIYGSSSSSRIANPANENQVYEWLLQETFDATGNHIFYEYARDNPQLYTGGALNTIYEQNRQPDQLYIPRIYYGNLPDPLLDEDGNSVTYADGTPVGHLRNGRRYCFEVVFDYGDWDLPTRDPHPFSTDQQELFGSSSIRDDRFSSFRARFEIRTLRRCRRVLMFHHFAELERPTLVRSTDFEYSNDPDTLSSLLNSVTVTGYKRDASGDYKSASMPPVTFKYSEFKPTEQRYQSLAARGSEMPPLALHDASMALVDLFGDGLPDVLQSNAGGFRYWRNLGGGLLDRPRPMPEIPAGITLTQPGVGFGDMGGDGRVDLLVHSGSLPGFFEMTTEGTWKTFKPYDVFPGFDLANPNVRLMDLTGDGSSDVLMTEEDSFFWFECLGEKGFAAPQAIARRRDLDQFPDVFFNDPAGRVRLADMTGDGLNDIVLIHNGRIEYWPNLGYGHFGKRITMENAPRLDVDFDPKRLFLADLNGTGCVDLVYVDFDRVHFWFNQSGNRWSDTQTILGTPVVSNVDSIQFADVFGTGTATLVWSYDFAGQPEANYKALDFCGGVKPYVLTEMSNNMGATTRVSYAPSTRYFLEDEANGNPWVTKLPFPVQLIDKVEVIDHISKTKLVTTYKYHHGYFDGREREFRGFGRVDQFDTETFEDFSAPGLHGESNLFDNNISAFHAPPVETRSWFHTGIYFDEDLADVPFDYHDLTQRYRREFYGGDDETFTLDEHDVETGETPHEAYRALRAALLRTEVYARDGSDKAAHPFSVTETRYRVRQLQPKQENQHAVYFTHQQETLTHHYERNPTDPRLSHAMTLAVDSFGNILKSLEIAYGRRQPDADLPTQADRDKQTQVHIIYSENTYTNAIDNAGVDPDNHRTPLPSESRSYELTGFKPANNAIRFSVDEWIENDFARLNQATEIAYEQSPAETQQQKRLIEHLRTYYRKNDLTELLPLGELESLALPGENFKLAFTPGLLTHVYGDRVTDSMLADEGGYVHTENDANWWIPSGRVFFSPNESDSPAEEVAFAQQHFYKACRTHDPFGNSTFTQYDPYDLFSVRTTDALGNQVIAEHDYRVLQPSHLVDPNGNQSQAAFDTLGLVVGSAVKGKAGQTLGDLIDSSFNPDPTPEQLAAFITNPLEASATTGESVPTQAARELLGNATTRVVYDLDRFNRTGEPPLTATLTRETHFADPGGSQTKIQISFSYNDGFGREIQKKIEAEPGTVVDGGPVANPRWVVSGWTIFNNKGKPVRKFEPFFSATHHFDFANTVGVSPFLFYDPIGRIVATLDPNHSWEKFIFDPWRQTTF
ncbi:MAG TPA: SpvB/TcaC N-terminal domain-containing protein, partial [Pyrinomonadaceae bacterium]|nr:SpvB/TcaC N-terminal domain-containing protein [Pyrinomonadaceae bacterium]